MKRMIVLVLMVVLPFTLMGTVWASDELPDAESSEEASVNEPNEGVVLVSEEETEDPLLDGIAIYEDEVVLSWARAENDWMEFDEGDEAVLRVIVDTGHDGVTYQWATARFAEIDEDIPGPIQYVLTPIEGAVESSYTVSESGMYACTVTDITGDSIQVMFSAYTNSADSSAPDETTITATAENGKTTMVYIVPYGGSVTLKASVTYGEAVDPANLSFRWYKYEESTNEWGGTTQHQFLVEGADGAELVIDNVTESTTYGFAYSYSQPASLSTPGSPTPSGGGSKNSSRANVYFRVAVESNLDAWLDGFDPNAGNYYISAKPGETLELRIAVNTNQPDNVTYSWNGWLSGYSSDGERTHRDCESNSDVLVFEDLNETGYISCTVTDPYGNSRSIGINVFLDNGFSAYPENAVGGSAAVNIAAEEGGSYELKVITEATDKSRIAYQWLYCAGSQREMTVGTSDTLLVKDLAATTTFVCRVIDGYGGDQTCYFHLNLNGDTNGNVGDRRPIGDLDGDCAITVRDAEYILSYPNATYSRNADVNSDGVVDELDAAQILQYSVGLIQFFVSAKGSMYDSWWVPGSPRSG